MPIQFLDLIFLICIIFSIFCNIFYQIKTKSRDSTSLVFVALLADLFIYALLLFLQWSSITDRLEPLEDISGAMLPTLWAFVFYVFIQEGARATLLQSEEKFSCIIRDSPFCIAIGDLRMDYFTLANQTFKLTFGVEDNTIDDNGFPSDFMWKSTRQKHEVIENITGNNYWHEPLLDLFTCSKTPIIVDARFNRITIGQQQHILATFNDITARIHSDQEKREMQLMLQQLADTIPEILFLVDIKSRRVIYTNNAGEKILGIRYDKNSYADYNTLFQNKIPDNEKKRLGIKPGWFYDSSPIDEEFRFNCREGKTIWLRLKSTPVYNNEGEPYRIVGIINDITAHKNTAAKEKLHRQQLQQAEKMASLGILVSGVAHEINNPNNFIMLNTPIIRDVWNGAIPVLDNHYLQNPSFELSNVPYPDIRDTVALLIDGIEQGTKRIMNIVNNLKDYAREDTCRFDERYDIRKTVRDAVMLTNNMINKSTSCFSVHYPDNPVMITGNSQKLEQVIINLIQNSCQSLTALNQPITINITSGENHCILTVIDDGTGIAEHDLTHVTDPFFTRKRKQGGTGLGLSISAGIIKEHNGTLVFESDGVKGTTATITLPLASKKNRDGNKTDPDS